MSEIIQIVERWNRENTNGVPVIYRRDSGGDLKTATRSTAFIMDGKKAAVLLYGVSYPVDLGRVSVRP